MKPLALFVKVVDGASVVVGKIVGYFMVLVMISSTI